MKSFALMVYVALASLGTQLMLKKGVNIITGKNIAYGRLDFLLQAALSPYIMAAVVLQVTGLLVWLFVISRMKLGIAVAVTNGFFYISLAMVSAFLFQERLSLFQWTGFVLIAAGILLMSLKLG